MSLDIHSSQSNSLFPSNSTSPLDLLLRLGNFFELDFESVNTAHIENELKSLEENWVQYNPYKPNIPRKALSITSLDGGISGKPDLYSLREFFRKEGVLYKESDFTTPTPYFSHFASLKEILGHFSPHLGRTHILRFDAGGYFPPHRDGAALNEPDTFRILVPLTKFGKSSVVFHHGNERLFLENGTVYFLNTLIEHSIFSFSDHVTMLICNVVLNHQSVRLVKSKLAQR